jgi:hypothetical protein
MLMLFFITALATSTVGAVPALAARATAVLFTTTQLAYEFNHCLFSSVSPSSFLVWQVSGANMQPSACAIPVMFDTVGTGASSSVAIGFSFGVSLVSSIAPWVLPVGLTQPVTPIHIRINVSNMIIFRSMSLLTAVFTTGRCVYLMCVYDDVFWKPSATLPLLGPFLITYFCVPLAPVFTSVRRCLCSCFSLDNLCCLAIASVIALESLIIILYTIFMRCQHG